MRRVQSLDFDSCTIIKTFYEGNLHMPSHTDKNSKISIVLDGSLIEKVDGNYTEAKRNYVVIKPNHIVHENIFGQRGASLLTINFKEKFTIPDDLNNWNWFDDPRLSFHAYKLWFSLKSVKNDKQLSRCINEFVQLLRTLKNLKENNIPSQLLLAAKLLRQFSLDGETIEHISEKMKISRVHLSRSFKRHYSVSAINYRHYVRLGNLMYCLASTNKSLANIAYECGFSDQSQMSRIILKETGYTPKILRLLLQKF